MLPDDRIVGDVLAGASGIIASLRPGALVIEMSTAVPRTKKALHAEARAKGVDFVDCPVGKTVDHAIAGTLPLMAGGEPGRSSARVPAWNNSLAKVLPDKALKRDFRPGFMARLAHKDVKLAPEMARELGVPMHQGEAAFRLLSEALGDGHGGDGTPGSMLRACEARSGVRVVDRARS